MISVIIPTRNRDSMLRETLISVLFQDLDPKLYEVIVVDNGSTDKTKDVVGQLENLVPNLKYIFEESLGLHYGRHAGIKSSKADIIVFIDDDVIVKEDWLSSINEAFSDLDVMMVGGSNLPFYQTTPPKWLVDMWNMSDNGEYKSIPSLSVSELGNEKKIISPYLVWGCNFAIRKSVLAQTEGFHPDGMPADLMHFRGDGETYVSKFVEDNGLKCVFTPGASLYHKVTASRMTKDYFYKRSFNQGLSDSFTDCRAEKDIKPHFLKFIEARIFAKSMITWLKLPKLGFHLCQVNNLMIKGYLRGYSYHRKLYLSDPKLKQWVRKDNYL